MLGQTLGSYTLERELGRGGMGAVYAAVHGLLGRRAAVKVLLTELSRDQAIVQRFFNEARTASAIKHPSIVEIYDFGYAPDGAAFIVMELMEGESLAARLKRQGRLPVATALVVARQVATALAAAHRAGIVHRDLKPDNAFLVADPEVTGGERVKLLDFGVAKLATETVGAARTTTGAILGTPHYMSPEQCEGSRAVDHRSDLYSLGVMLFQMISGRLPFVGEGMGGIIGAHLFVAPPLLRSLAPDAPAEVEAFVSRLLAKTPEERPQSADEVVAALGRLAGTSGALVAPVPITAPPAGATPSLGHALTLPTPSPPGSAPGTGAPIGFSPTMPSTPAPMPIVEAPHPSTPTTLSSAVAVAQASSLSPLPVSAASQPPPRSRRGLLFALAGVVVGGTVVALALAASGPGSPATTPTDAAVVLVPADAAVDASPAVDALAEMAEAFARRDYHRVRLLLDTVYDHTTDGDPLRARADDFITQARPLSIAADRAEIARLVKRGDCMEARLIAAEAATHWNREDTDDTEALTRTAARCQLREPTTGGGPGSSAGGSTGGGSTGGGSGSGSSGGGLGGKPPKERTAAERVDAISTAAKTGQWAIAADGCREVLRLDLSGDLRDRAQTTCLLAACKLPDRKLLRALLPRVSAARIGMARNVCQQQGVDIEPFLAPGLPPPVPEKGGAPVP